MHVGVILAFELVTWVVIATVLKFMIKEAVTVRTWCTMTVINFDLQVGFDLKDIDLKVTVKKKSNRHITKAGIYNASPF